MSELEQQLRRTARVARVARTNWLVTLYNNAADRIAELESNQKRLMTAIICYDDCDSAGQYMRAQATMLKVVAEIEKAEGE